MNSSDFSFKLYDLKQEIYELNKSRKSLIISSFFTIIFMIVFTLPLFFFILLRTFSWLFEFKELQDFIPVLSDTDMLFYLSIGFSAITSALFVLWFTFSVAEQDFRKRIKKKLYPKLFASVGIRYSEKPYLDRHSHYYDHQILPSFRTMDTEDQFHIEDKGASIDIRECFLYSKLDLIFNSLINKLTFLDMFGFDKHLPESFRIASWRGILITKEYKQDSPLHSVFLAKRVFRRGRFYSQYKKLRMMNGITIGFSTKNHAYHVFGDRMIDFPAVYAVHFKEMVSQLKQLQSIKSVSFSIWKNQLVVYLEHNTNFFESGHLYKNTYDRDLIAVYDDLLIIQNALDQVDFDAVLKDMAA